MYLAMIGGLFGFVSMFFALVFSVSGKNKGAVDLAGCFLRMFLYAATRVGVILVYWMIVRLLGIKINFFSETISALVLFILLYWSDLLMDKANVARMRDAGKELCLLGSVLVVFLYAVIHSLAGDREEFLSVASITVAIAIGGLLPLYHHFSENDEQGSDTRLTRWRAEFVGNKRTHISFCVACLLILITGFVGKEDIAKIDWFLAWMLIGSCVSAVITVVLHKKWRWFNEYLTPEKAQADGELDEENSVDQAE